MIEWLEGRQFHGIRPGLDRIRALLDRLDNPQAALRVVHIGGTNGKGSTQNFLVEILQAAGLKVGCFSSPGLTLYDEVQVNGQPISESDYQVYLKVLRPHVEALDQKEGLFGLTRFEIVTALMFLYLKDQGVDLALVEVGMGGREDSTNVVDQPLVSVLTSIAFDHPEFLGSRIEEIARHKAGIIKAGRPVVSGALDSASQAVIGRYCQELRARHFVLGRDFNYEETTKSLKNRQVANLTSHKHGLADVTIGSLGRHQLANAAVAVQTYEVICQELGVNWKEAAVRQGLASASLALRLEVVASSPLTLLDGAHNLAAVEALMDFIEADLRRPVHLLVSIIKTKDAEVMIGKMLANPLVANLTLTSFDDWRAWTKGDLRQLAEVYADNPRLVVQDDWRQALVDLGQQAGPAGTVIVTGSLYFLQQLRPFLLK